MTANPERAIGNLKGVGPKLEETLARLGISRFIDLLLHLPMRYQDRTRVTATINITPDAEYLVEGRVVACQVIFGRRRSLKVTLEDDTGRVYLRFFHFSRFQQKQLNDAEWVRAFGEFRFFGRELSCAHPEYETYNGPPPAPEASLTPIYPTTQGLGQARLRTLLATLCALDWPDTPGTPFQTLRALHQPPPDTHPEQIADWQAELAREELLAYYLVMKGRALKRQAEAAIALPQAQGLGRQLLDHLGFKLTRAQARVVGEVLEELARPVPMLRLVQGDVGSGKTVVAAFAAIRAAEQGCQTAIMAPTELLAEQHYANFRNWLTPLGIETILLTGRMPAAEQRAGLAAAGEGSAQVIIGTHALFQARVSFHSLALSIIDEQHRFGVHQRMALQTKSGDARPHQLIMTATPIPRTLTMALYADMAVSVIDELPSGRQPITTHTVEEGRRTDVAAQLARILAQGQQAYWVCPLIEDSDELEATSVTWLVEWLAANLPGARIAQLHGRMSSSEKTAAMQAFTAREIDVLVATTVVEVGVDVPNATHMIIENAERFGLAQLHQLRGRVGRGQLASHCFLLFKSGLSAAARTRLSAMRDSQDGFWLAEQDLKLRGPGDILGTRQSGEQSFRIADLAAHAHLIPAVTQRGDAMLNAAPDSPEHAEMQALLRTWAPADTGNLTA